MGTVAVVVVCWSVIMLLCRAVSGSVGAVVSIVVVCVFHDSCMAHDTFLKGLIDIYRYIQLDNVSRETVSVLTHFETNWESACECCTRRQGGHFLFYYRTNIRTKELFD